MNQPWGISGPDFLVLYGIALGVCVAIAIATRIAARRVGDTYAKQVGELEIEEYAYLAGGPRRVAELAVARLIKSGSLRSSRTGKITTVAKAAATNPVDHAVLQAAAGQPKGTATVVERVVKHSSVTSIGKSLAGKGLVVDNASSRAKLGAAPLGLLFAVGVVRFLNGLAGDYPVGWLALELGITVALLAVFLLAPMSNRTAEGSRLLREGKNRHKAHAGRSTGDSGGGLEMSYAFGGVMIHSDSDLNSAFSGSDSGYSSGGSDGGGSSGGDGGGSSGGGGGCGGGGSS